MGNIFFQPFVGKDYAKGGIFGKRIMILGESHYCEGCLDCGLLASSDRGMLEITVRAATQCLVAALTVLYRLYFNSSSVNMAL